ncbi:hypothetical protein HGI79_22095 [Clostridium sp. DJ247]|nr:hypothetical protein [Clostridium sp. DJ247]
MNKQEYKEYMRLQREKVYDKKGSNEKSYTRAQKKLDKLRENIANGFKLDIRSAGDPKKQLFSGSEWNEYFRKDYGARKVKWNTKETRNLLTDGTSNVKKPAFEVSRATYPNHVKMLENAQKDGHTLNNLERGSGTRAANKNRYNSQKEIRKNQGPPPKGFDYDEFPYASTKQGGEGAHVEPVPSAENQAVGRDLGQFYRKYNIKEGDLYDVKITD